MSVIYNKYKMLEALGRGGGGEVFLAENITTGQKVALKIITPDAGFDKALIEKEIKALSNLDHPRIVSFIESFEDQDIIYLATELLDGKTLDEKLEGNPLELEAAEKYTDQLLEALDYIHGKGIIHSDLKPENIIIDNNDNVRLIDFGIVRSASAEIASDIKEIRGTLHYMSPEQANGNPYDVRSDFFSLGTILYEMLTGHRPFYGDYDMAVIYAILYEEAVPPDRLNASIPAGLSHAILQFLSKDPADRPGSAAQARKILMNHFGDSVTEQKSEGTRLAVMPFEFPQKDSDSQLIAEGLRDELNERLKNIKDIELVSPAKVDQHLGKLTEGEEIRKILGADNYLTGKIRKITQRIRIYMMLLSTDDDSVSWSDKYDSPLSDLFDVIDNICQHIMTRFQTQCDEEPRVAPSRPEAYELFLLARGYYVKNSSKDIEIARNMFREALKIDPDYALAHVGVADCYTLEYVNYFNRTEGAINEAIKYANRALELVPNLPEAYRSLGRAMQVTGKVKEAANYYLKAVTYKEDYQMAYRSLGWLALECLKYDEALKWVRKALSINSTDIETIFLKGTIHFEHRQSKPAINDFTRCLELRPDYGRAYFYMGMTYCQLGRIDDAIDSLEKAVMFGGDINAPYLLGYYYIINGEFDRAGRTLTDAVTRPEIRFIAEFYLGLLFHLQGMDDMARKHFEISAELSQELFSASPEFAVAGAVLIKDLALLEKYEECQELIDKLNYFALVDGSIAIDVAKVYAIMDYQNKAEATIRRALDTPQGPTLPEISLDPILKKYYRGPTAD